MGDSSTTTGWAGGYGELWRSEPSLRARIVVLAIALPIAGLLVLAFGSEITYQRSVHPDEWTRSLVLCIAGVLVNVCWIAFAALRSPRSLRPVMLFILPGVILNCVLVAFAIGIPYY